MKPGLIIWNTICLVFFFLGFGMWMQKCQDDYSTYIDKSKLDSIQKSITQIQTRVDSLNVQKKKLVSEQKTIHEESTKTIERILLAPDSSQHLITEELIWKHKQLDSIK